MQEEANKKSERIILELNKSGMEYLSHEQYRQALELLKKAQKLINNELRMREKDAQLNKLYGITLNNLGCYYKKTNKPKVALSYLKKALQREVYNVEDWIATAGTHLNICAIFSFTGKHQEAADHAALSVKLLQRERLSNTKNTKESPTLNNMLMISYYNLGVELEHLKIFHESCEAYKKGVDIAKLTKKGGDMLIVLEDSVIRTTKANEAYQKRIYLLIEKKKEQEEKGHCEFMRKNKKHETQPSDESEMFGRYIQHSQPRVRGISSTQRMNKGRSEARMVRKNQSKILQPFNVDIKQSQPFTRE